MAKPRVHEIAKEIGITSKELLGKLKEMGEFVSSPSSTLEAPVVRKIREAYTSDPAPAPTSEPAQPKAPQKAVPTPKAPKPTAPAKPAAKPVARPAAPKPAAPSESEAPAKPVATQRLQAVGGTQLRDADAVFGRRPHDRRAFGHPDLMTIDAQAEHPGGRGCRRAEIDIAQ